MCVSVSINVSVTMQNANVNVFWSHDKLSGAGSRLETQSCTYLGLKN